MIKIQFYLKGGIVKVYVLPKTVPETLMKAVCVGAGEPVLRVQQDGGPQLSRGLPGEQVSGTQIIPHAVLS